MEYRARLFAHEAFGYFVVSLFAFFALCFPVVGAYRELALMVVFAALLVIRLRTRKMVFSADSFHYDGWVTSFSIPFDEIRSVVPASAFGYPTDRIHGGQYCVLTKFKKRHWVTLLWFSPAACRRFDLQLVHRSHADSVA